MEIKNSRENNKINRLLIICGPTATGKTDLAINLANKFDGEIVSADSRQVYKGMDIGTGKGINKIPNSKFQIPNKFQIPSFGFAQDKNSKFQIGYYLINGVKIWLYDVVEPDYQFNVADYLECANLVISDILERKKLPILVGGTGLYLKAVVDGIETIGVPPDWELREKLSNLEIEKLREILKKICPERLKAMNESDRGNPRRLIRAIEIVLKIPNSKSQIPNKFQIPNSKSQIPNKFQSQNPKFEDILFIGLTAPFKYLYQRIDKRVSERVKRGIENEIKMLLEVGYKFKNSALGTTIGYREWQSYFKGESTISEVIKQWKFNEHSYARRQMIWFKKNKRIKWFNILKENYQKEVEKMVKDWLEK